jgi:hypothetical protein
MQVGLKPDLPRLASRIPSNPSTHRRPWIRPRQNDAQDRTEYLLKVGQMLRRVSNLTGCQIPGKAVGRERAGSVRMYNRA